MNEMLTTRVCNRCGRSRDDTVVLMTTEIVCADCLHGPDDHDPDARPVERDLDDAGTVLKWAA